MASTFTIIAVSGALMVSTIAPTGAHISSGELYLDGQMVKSSLSLNQTSFRYFFFYFPEVGLVTVSNQEFDGASVSGSFEGGTLVIQFGGHNLSLHSLVPILNNDFTDAWVRFDPDYRLEGGHTMFGYGQDESEPTRWHEYLHADD